MKDFARRTPATKVAPLEPGKGPALVDNRATTVAQRKTQEIIANSPRQATPRPQTPVPLAAPRPNLTGLPDQLKAGVESLSGYSLDDVQVHYNSSKPARLQAHAYAQGTDIHLAPGQEQHLPHEAWHVVQQKQGRVQPTMQLKGKVVLNDDAGLEQEADIMGNKAPYFLEDGPVSIAQRMAHEFVDTRGKNSQPVQRQVAGWTAKTLPADTFVFHNTDATSALSIITKHIQPVVNAYDGGELGSGFYTYTVKESAENFAKNTTLKFKVTAEAIGQHVPKDATWKKLAPYAADALAGNDFLWTEEDPNQYKFHSGAKLELVAVFDVTQNTEYTKSTYLDMLDM